MILTAKDAKSAKDSVYVPKSEFGNEIAALHFVSLAMTN